MLSFTFYFSLFSCEFQNTICIGMNVTITCLFVESDRLWTWSFFSLILGCFDFFPLLSSWIHSWVWCLVIKYFFPCLSHLFVAHWFETWNVAFHDSFCFYFSFVFYFRIPFHISNACLWGFFWKLLEHGIQILKNEVEIKCRVLCKLICWNRGRSYTCCLGSHRKVVLGICFKKEFVLKRKKIRFRMQFWVIKLNLIANDQRSQNPKIISLKRPLFSLISIL